MMQKTQADSGTRHIGPVDVLIAGGTASGVALALSAAEAGLRVFLAGSRPYLGEDLCGDMRYWAGEEADPQSGIARRVYGGSAPVRPMHLKRELEQAMVEAGVPFLLNAPVEGLLTTTGDRCAGVLLGTRSGTLRVEAGLVVDASTEGALSRLAGLPGESPFKGLRRVEHTTLCHDDGADADGLTIVRRPAGFTLDTDEYTGRLSARTYQMDVDFGDGSLREIMRAEAEIVRKCWVPTEFSHQERIRIVDTSAGGAEYFPDHNEVPALAGFMSISPAVSADAAHRRALDNPVASMDWAGGLGAFLSGIVHPSSPVTGPISEKPFSVEAIDQCDVLVLGGGTAGASAAIAAARTGAETILIESMDRLGGVGTVGQIASYWFGNRVGFTEEIDTGVNELEHDPKIRKHGSRWTVNAKAQWYLNTCMDAGVTVLFRSLSSGALREGNRINGLKVVTPFGAGIIHGKCTVDATGCADVPASVGGETRQIAGDHVAVQGTGLAGIAPGHDYHNSDHNFCDDSDVFDTTAFLVSTKLKFPDHFDAGQLVDSRERRQIVGDVILGPSDFLSNRTWPDTICVASSNFDAHGFTIHPVFTCKPPDKKRLWADVPLRALLPKGLERVLVTGLGVSAHRDALPVIRMQADVQNQGYAAGLVAAQAALADTDIRQLPVREIQKDLLQAGIIPERALEETDNFPVDSARLHEAVHEGWDSYAGLAIIFAEPERALPILREALAGCDEAVRSTRYALILGLLEDRAGKEVLFNKVKASDWDEGWNFRGMHQFGMSFSELDATLVALARIGDSTTWPLFIEKAGSLGTDPDLSHCRAVAEAFETLYSRIPDPAAAPAIASLIARTQLRGHAQRSLTDVQAVLSEDPNDNTVRNDSLRELHLARGLYRCGDHDGLGESILREYADDLRAHYARHAQSILNRA